jgi:pimeloyl-ACP methyl ester carboxylesterase
MGNTTSFTDALERLTCRGVYKAPPVGYRREACQIATTPEGMSIAMFFHSADEQVTRRFYEYKKLDSSRVLVLFSHGNSVDIGGCRDLCEHLSASLDVDVLTYDYPGYGHSSKCAATERGMSEAIETVYNACVQKGTDPKQIVLAGHSLGSVPTLHLASRCYVTYLGVLLFAPLASGCRVAAQNRGYIPTSVLGALDRVLFDNLKNIEDAKAPVAIVHGTRDTVVSVKHSEMLHLSTPNSLKYAPLYMDADHNGVLDCTGRNAADTKKYIGDFLTYLKNESGASEYPAGVPYI